MSKNFTNKNLFKGYKEGEKKSFNNPLNKNIIINTSYKNYKVQYKDKFITKYRDESLNLIKPPKSQRSSPKKITTNENKVIKIHRNVENTNSENNEIKNINKKLNVFEKNLVSIKDEIVTSNKNLKDEMVAIKDEIKTSNSKILNAIEKLYSKNEENLPQNNFINIKKSEDSFSIHSISLNYILNKSNKNKSSSSSSEKVLAYNEGDLIKSGEVYKPNQTIDFNESKKKRKKKK